MSAEQFLKKLEATGLLDASLLARLWKQVATSSGGVSAESIAAALVKSGQLTRTQADKLLGENFAGRARSVPGRGGASSSPAKPAPRDDDLDLAPLDDEESPKPPTAGSPAKASPKRGPESMDLVLLDDELETGGGLVPLDDGGLVPLDEGGLEPLGASGLEPLPSSGLEPLPTGGLEPLPSRGLEPLPSASVPPNAPRRAEPVRAGGGLEPVDSPRGAGAPSGPPARSAPAPRQARKNPWDSTLLYVGGGSLALLIIVGVALYYLVFRGTADEVFGEADDFYRSQSYSQAIPKFEKFVASFPDDPKASLARVRIGTAQLWQKLDSRDKKPALQAAQEILPRIESEEAFPEVRAELATILPEIAQGFAEPARQQEDIEQARQLVDLAGEAMKLLSNPAYIPTSLRSPIETRIAGIEENIQLAKRNIDRTQQLADAVERIRAAAAAGNTRDAFEIRRALLRQYPELEASEALRSAVADVTASERALVQVVEQPQESAAEDHPPAAQFRVALASVRKEGDAETDEERVVCFLARGGLYGLQAKTGKPLWRRYVGQQTRIHPQAMLGAGRDDVIAADLQRHELLRLRARTGELIWRFPLGEPFAEPLVVGERMLVATRSGKLFEIEAESGKSPRHAIIPQPLPASPSVGQATSLYLVGEHSNVYLLDATTLRCREVFYLGHREGTVVVPPVSVLGHVFVAENGGQDYCDLHVLAADADGLSLKPAAKPIRLAGRVVVPPLSAAGRVTVITDRGAVRILEVNTSDPKKPVLDVVEPLVASFKSPLISYPVFDDGRLWIGNNRFSRYDVQTARNRMVCAWIQNERDTFVAPPRVIGNTVFHLRRRENSPAFTAAAVSGEDGKAIWEVDLATPPGLVAVDAEKKQIHAVTAQAELFEISTGDFQTGLLDRPVAGVIAARNAVLSESFPLDAQQWVLAGSVERGQVVIYAPQAPRAGARLQAANLSSAGSAALTSLPAAFQGGLLLPLDNGQVLLVDPATGEDKILPFQPRVEAGRKVQWRRPARLAADTEEFVIADDRKKLYRVGVRPEPKPHLSAAAEVELSEEIASDLAVAGDTIYGAVRGPGSDTIVSYSAGDLAAGETWPLEGRIAWGPESAGDVVLLATQDQLICFDSGQQQRWTSPLRHGPLAGRPLPVDGGFLLASRDGVVWRVSAKDGSEAEGQQSEVGEPLGLGPVLFNGRLLLSAADGTLLIVPAL